MKTYFQFKIIAISLILMTVIIVPKPIQGWFSESTYYTSFPTPKFSTHQWLAIEAIKLFKDAEIQWITNNLESFTHGIEAPYNANAAYVHNLNTTEYGDIEDLVLFFENGGINVTTDSLAVRAFIEYGKLVNELMKDNLDYSLAAFYTGAMSHYIAQAGVWGAIWNPTEWGEVSISNWTKYETAIELGLTHTKYNSINLNCRFNNLDVYKNLFFNLTPLISESLDAYNSTIFIGQKIYQYAHFLGSEIDTSILEAKNWPTDYYNATKLCLTYSIEGIYSSIKSAIKEAHLKYISMPKPTFSYNVTTGYLTIPEFQVKYFNYNSYKTLTNDNATKAEFYLINYDSNNKLISISDEINQLQFNLTSNKWFYPNSFVKGLTVKTTHSIIYCFNMNKSIITWSNLTLDYFKVNYFNFSILSYYYNYADFSLNVSNIKLICQNHSDIGFIDNNETYLAEWALYYGQSDISLANSIIVPVYDTVGNIVEGQLNFDNQTNSWYSLFNDIGLVFTPIDWVIYLVLKFNLTYLPCYTGKIIPPYVIDYFYIRFEINTSFITDFHLISISKPIISYDGEKGEIEAKNIKAFQNYKNIELDFYEVHEKDIYGSDRRSAKWAIFHISGVSTAFNGDLKWNNVERYWYIEKTNIKSLKGFEYYIKCSFTTMNTEPNYLFWSPKSDNFQVGIGYSTFQYIFLILFVPVIIYFIYTVFKLKKK